MREETRRQLERAIRMQRLKYAGAVLAVAVVVGAGFWLEGRDATVERVSVSGVVTEVSPPKVRTSFATGTQNMAVAVRLDDGRIANVLVRKGSEPHVGDRVAIMDHVHGTGRHTFSWN